MDAECKSTSSLFLSLSHLSVTRLAPRTDFRSYVTGSIHGWSRLHSTIYIRSGSRLDECKLTWQAHSNTLEFLVQYHLKSNIFVFENIFVNLLIDKTMLHLYNLLVSTHNNLLNAASNKLFYCTFVPWSLQSVGFAFFAAMTGDADKSN